MGLPLFNKANDQNFSLMQTSWKSQIDPLIINSITKGNQKSNVSLIIGENVINHLLGRNMIGWFITDITSGAQVYRSQPMNDKTLVLTSNAIATVNIWCY